MSRQVYCCLIPTYKPSGPYVGYTSESAFQWSSYLCVCRRWSLYAGLVWAAYPKHHNGRWRDILLPSWSWRRGQIRRTGDRSHCAQWVRMTHWCSCTMCVHCCQYVVMAVEISCSWLAPCWLLGWKNTPAPFPGRMS